MLDFRPDLFCPGDTFYQFCQNGAKMGHFDQKCSRFTWKDQECVDFVDMSLKYVDFAAEYRHVMRLFFAVLCANALHVKNKTATQGVPHVMSN